MRVVLKSYAVKNASAPGTKAKKLKANKNFNVNRKTLGGVKDNRKFINDNALSEAEKIARRMDLENIKNKVKSHKMNKGDSLFSSITDDKDWASDPMMMKVKQLGSLDEGLDESSDDDDDSAKGDVSKCFADGRKEKPKKKTLEDMIRDSKIKKAEKKSANDESSILTKSVNIQFRDTIRHILPQIGANLKAKYGDTNKMTKDDELGNQFEKDFNELYMADAPRSRGTQPIVKQMSQKENDKLVTTKLEKLQERLKVAGIITENDDVELYESDLDSDKEEDGSENMDELEASEDEQSEDEVQIEESSEGSDCHEEKDSDLSLSDNDNSKNNIQKLKSCITSTKAGKRKLISDEEVSNKKARLDSNKNEIDCLRALAQMVEMKDQVMLLLSSKIDSFDMGAKSVSKKLVMAYLLQEALETNSPYSYSPELVRFLRVVLRETSRDSWLHLSEDLSAMKREDLIGICNEEEGSPRLAVSTMYHTARLLSSVIKCNQSLPNKRSLFLPLESIITNISLAFYPPWLMEEVAAVRDLVVACVAEYPPIMRQKKPFHIVELLEPDIEDKFNSNKKVTNTLKKKVKNEMKALRKEIKLDTKQRVMEEVAVGRKDAEIRSKKTLSILNGLHQMD